MAIYSVDSEKLSGIKAHTIRIWEQRYKIIEPDRTPSNIRYYRDDDLKLLLQCQPSSTKRFQNLQDRQEQAGNRRKMAGISAVGIDTTPARRPDHLHDGNG